MILLQRMASEQKTLQLRFPHCLQPCCHRQLMPSRADHHLPVQGLYGEARGFRKDTHLRAVR